ncbi:MAG: L-aspartate oxidase [Sarcina sp.]
MEYDVIIVGSGIAGLFACLKIRRNLKVLVITKKSLKDCNSYLAQGGISVQRNDDDFESFLEDTLKAGKYKNNKEAVSLMINSSREVISDLIDLKVDFDKDGDELRYTKEGAHSDFRIVHHKDITGREIIDKLVEEVLQRKNIKIKEDVAMIDLLVEENKCTGIKIIEEDEAGIYKADRVVLATGGIGGMFDNSTNYSHIKGDGINVALNNDIECKDLNYIQIHPTALFVEGKERRFLISESLRGEGAYLLNKDGERFVDELLPRDVVSNAIFKELERTGEKNVYLSFNHRGVEFVENRFPNIYKKCKEAGYNLGEDKIPVAPAQHYFMGGICIDENGRTSLENLYAVGETSCLGIHGENRLASNSLLEALVFSKRVAKDINRQTILVEEEKKRIRKVRNQYEKNNVEDTTKNYEVKLSDVKFREIVKRGNRDFYDKWFR